MKEKMEDFASGTLIVFVCVVMAAIAWAMWKPVLLDQNNLVQIGKALNAGAETSKRLEAEIATLKIEQGKLWEKKKGE